MSIKSTVTQPASSGWRQAGHRYHSYNFFLRRRFGQRVQKVSVDGAFTCPNVDGTVATGGCVFCDNRSFSPSRRVPRQAILDQIEDGIRRLRQRYDVEQFLAYFQPATNTYAPLERLRPLYESALEHPRVVGLVVGTRPDCLPSDVLDYLTELADRTYLSLEIGLQSAHDRSLDWMNRGHGYAEFLDAVDRSWGRGFELCTHVILGLPGETHADMMFTASELARLRLDAVKIHNLYAVQHTPLADDVRSGKVKLMERAEYIQTAIDFLERLPPSSVVERLCGDAPPAYLVGPAWTLDKPAFHRALLAEMERRDSWQGKRYERQRGEMNTPLVRV